MSSRLPPGRATRMCLTERVIEPLDFADWLRVGRPGHRAATAMAHTPRSRRRLPRLAPGPCRASSMPPAGSSHRRPARFSPSCPFAVASADGAGGALGASVAAMRERTSRLACSTTATASAGTYSASMGRARRSGGATNGFRRPLGPFPSGDSRWRCCPLATPRAGDGGDPSLGAAPRADLDVPCGK